MNYERCATRHGERFHSPWGHSADEGDGTLKKTPLKIQEKRYGKRRKGLKWLLGIILFATLVVIGGGLWRSIRRRGIVVNVPVTLPQNVNRRDSGVTLTHFEEGREIFTVHAARTLAYGRGSRKVLDGVQVIIFGRQGDRHDEIHAGRCQYDSETSALACIGKASVKLESRAGMKMKPNLQSQQPLFLDTSDISFDPEKSTVKTRRAVRFRFGPATGFAKGLIYNTNSGGLNLERAVELSLPGRTGGEPPAEVSAGGLLFNKQRQEILLSSPVRLAQGRRVLNASVGEIDLDAKNRMTRITFGGVRGVDELASGSMKGAAESLEADFDPGTSRIRNLLATGHVWVEDRSEGGASGASLRRLTAGRVSLRLFGVKSEPRSGVARGGVKVVFQPAKGNGGAPPVSGLRKGPAPGERILSASELFLTFQSRGLLKEAHTGGPGAFQLIPTNPAHDRQTVTAGRFEMAFDTAGRLHAIHGFSPTRIVDQPPATASSGGLPSVSTADHLVAELDPATGSLVSLEQMGHYRFHQGDRRASAVEAWYQAGKQNLALAGAPDLWDSNGRLRARHIHVNLANGVACGWGGVQSVYFGSPGGKQTSSRPAQDELPMIVLADRVTVYRQQEYAHYEGNVRASHGADVVESSALDIYRKRQRLSSGEGVVTSLVEPALTGRTPSKKHKAQDEAVQPVTIRADRLIYFNLGREAVYRGNVQMISANTTFHSNRLEVYFSTPAGYQEPQVDKAIADGNVRVTELPGRHARSNHAVYDAGTGKVVLTGGPPVIYEADKGYLRGKQLTFFIRDASLFASGGNKSQTVSKRRIHQP